MKTVSPITDDTIIETLRTAKRSDPRPYVRERAHTILLSAKGYSLSKIGDIFEVQYQTVSRWIDDWERSGIQGLRKRHDGGAQPIFDETETQRLLELIAEEPRRLAYVQEKLERETGKKASLSTLQRLIKKMGLVYKRARLSCRHKRDQENFDRCQPALKNAQDAEQKGIINLFYFDEAGFSQQPCVPYAWQQKGEQLRLPSVKSRRVNILGFMNRSNDLFYYPVIGSVTGDTVIEVFDDFAEKMQDPKYSSNERYTLVIVDSASMHTCQKFQDQLDDWMIEKRLIVCYLPAYSPELNLIEILWREVKYAWLDIMTIMDFDAFQKELRRALDAVGREYSISIA